MNPASHFTAAQFALALGITKRAVLQMLGAVPSTVVASQGGEAKAWAVSALPSAWRAQLEARAPQLGCRDAEHLLQEGCKPWTLPLPIAKVAPRFLTKAASLRDALAQPLRQQHEIQGAALDELGVAEYARVFGHAITARHWRRLFERTVDRDRNREEWQRLEIYIEDAALLRKQSPPSKLEAAFNHDPLSSMLEELTDRANPTAEDRAWVFHNAFRHFEQLSSALDNPRSQAALKASLIDYLLAALGPAFSKTPQALRRLFDRKLSRWTDGGRNVGAILDQRPTKSGQAPYTCPPCEMKVNHQARNYRGQDGKMGNMSLAWRQLWTKGEICPQCQERYSLDMRKNKSYVPSNFRRRATPLLLELAVDRGPKHARDAGPYIPRDYTDTKPGETFVLDDETPNQISYDYVDGQLLIGAVQNIEAIDARCFYPLDFNMYIGAPSGMAIRCLLWQLFVGSRIGLPDLGLILEGGAFASRLVVGSFQPKHERSWIEAMGDFKALLELHLGPLETADSELGIREAGVAIHRARTHRAKIIEGYFNHTQRLTSHLPGYAGNNQRFEISQRLNEFVARCKAGKEDPRTELLSIEELRKNYKASREEYMHTPQNGNLLRGASPFEMWQERIARKPLRTLPPELEYLVSTHKRPATVTARGIRIKLSSHEDALYCSPELGQWHAARINKVLAFTNVFDRRNITVSDMNRENYLTVPRVLCKSRTATREELKEAHRLTRGYIAGATAGFGKLSHPLLSTIIRDSEHTEASKDLGRFHNKATEQQKTAESEVQKFRRRINTLSDELGRPRPDYNTLRVNLRQELAALEWEMETRNKTAPVTSTP